jgi:hypothetical protein
MAAALLQADFPHPIHSVSLEDWVLRAQDVENREFLRYGLTSRTQDNHPIDSIDMYQSAPNPDQLEAITITRDYDSILGFLPRFPVVADCQIVRIPRIEDSLTKDVSILVDVDGIGVKDVLHSFYFSLEFCSYFCHCSYLSI